MTMPTTPQPTPQPNKVEINEGTFVETVIKIIGPQIVADFIKRTWDNLSDENRASISKTVSDLLIKNISLDSHELRWVVENKVRETAGKVAEELSIIHYPKILEHANVVYKKIMNDVVERACKDAVNETLKAVNQRLTKELDNIIWNRKG